MNSVYHMLLAGTAAGAVAGVFGGGGGLVLVPLLERLSNQHNSPFFASVAIMAPICIAALLASSSQFPWDTALPYLLGGAAGGLCAGLTGDKIPTLWLHRLFGAFLLWGGIRNIC